MRGFSLLLGFLFHISCAYAQLSLKPSEKGTDHYLFVSSGVLYVSNDIQLQKNSSVGSEASIYLRGESQLLQGEEQLVKNSGTGTISVFQEGTANAYDYNFWSSPVTQPGQDLFGIRLLHAPQSVLKSYPAAITEGFEGTANPLSISSRWIYTFSGTGYHSWDYMGANFAIPKGYGFSMKGTNGVDLTVVDGLPNNPGNAQRYDFRGRPNSGLIAIPISPESLVLVGNPYPSALDLSQFLLENSGTGNLRSGCGNEISRKNVITGVAYFWDSKEHGNSHYLEDYEGGYGAFSPVDVCTSGIYERPIFKSYSTEKLTGSFGQHYDRRFLPIAQGFMVQGTSGQDLIFRNSHRAYQKEGSYSHFKQAAGKDKYSGTQELQIIPKLQLLVNFNNEYTRSLSLAFWPTATHNVDAGMDALAYDLAPADAGWLQDDQSFVIDVRPFDITAEIPLFLEVKEHETRINFSAGAVEKLDLQNLYILDSEVQTYYPITKEVFSIDLVPGTYHGRFKLAFMEKIEGAVLPEELLNEGMLPVDFSIFQNNLSGELQIVANSSAPVKSVGLFDLHGKRIFFRSNFENRRSVKINTQHVASAVYIVKVMNMDNTKTSKKIWIYN